MDAVRIIKDFFWGFVKLLPFHSRYYFSYWFIRRRPPRFFVNRNYCDYIFADCFWGRHDQHAYLADKLLVRDYVEERGLGSILTKLYGAWEDANDIDFDSLPNQFALKCNHSCGMNIICFDKSKFNFEEAKKQLNEWLKMKHPIFQERHYYKIKPMIICEEMIPNNADGFFPMDFKIHCANGKPVFIQCCFERTDNSAGRRVIYDTNWNNLHYVLNDSHFSEVEVPKPLHLNEMLEYATKLSSGLDYARIDLYDTDTRVIFGEITLTPMGGWLTYFKKEALAVMGRAIRQGKKQQKLLQKQ